MVDENNGETMGEIGLHPFIREKWSACERVLYVVLPLVF